MSEVKGDRPQENNHFKGGTESAGEWGRQSTEERDAKKHSGRTIVIPRPPPPPRPPRKDMFLHPRRHAANRTEQNNGTEQNRIGEVRSTKIRAKSWPRVAARVDGHHGCHHADTGCQALCGCVLCWVINHDHGSQQGYPDIIQVSLALAHSTHELAWMPHE